MNNTFQTVLATTVVATGAIAAYTLVGFDDAGVDAVDAPVKGVALNPASAAGEAITGLVIGTVQVKGTGVIVAGDPLVSSATGGVQKAGADPANAFAVALTDAADGHLVEILIR